MFLVVRKKNGLHEKIVQTAIDVYYFAFFKLIALITNKVIIISASAMGSEIYHSSKIPAIR